MLAVQLARNRFHVSFRRVVPVSGESYVNACSRQLSDSADGRFRKQALGPCPTPSLQAGS